MSKIENRREVEKCYTINRIVHIATNTLMKLYHLKDLQEFFPDYDHADHSDHAE